MNRVSSPAGICKYQLQNFEVVVFLRLYDKLRGETEWRNFLRCRFYKLQNLHLRLMRYLVIFGQFNNGISMRHPNLRVLIYITKQCIAAVDKPKFCPAILA
jgi:hypothetical protein